MDDVLAIVLGGGQGSRLFPLTHQRSKPAVPIGGKYRLIDVPISNCLHADLRRIFVLTQFNSQSLNHHVAQTYRMDPFSHGFVDIIAAEQTPDSSSWFQGTADAVRQAARHFRRYAADYYLILAGDQLYRMDYGRLLDAHVDGDADITVAALPVTPQDAPAMGIFLFDREFEQFGRFGNAARQPVKYDDHTFQLCLFLPEGSGPIRISPDCGILEFALDFGQSFCRLFVVKGTPLTPECVPSDRRPRF